MPDHGRAAVVATLATLAGCAGTAPPAAEVRPPAPVAAVERPPAAPAWPEAADCRGLAAAVLAMPEAERARLRAETAPLALAVADGPGLLRPEEAAAAVEVDLPVAVVDRTDGMRCLALVGRPRVVPGGGRRLVAHELVRSEHRTGTRRRANPAYEGSREDAREGEGGAGRVMATGEPALDLIGLIAGGVIRSVGRLRAGRGGAATGERPAAGAERYVEEAVFEPYTYEISSFEVGRAGAMGLALADLGRGTALEASHTVRERRIFPVASGRHRADRGVLEGGGPAGLLPEDVAVFEGAPPRPRLSGLLVALLDGGGDGSVASLGDVLGRLKGGPAEFAASPPVGPGPATPRAEDAAKRVTVETLAGPAEGTWLDGERIAVPSASLGRSSLVQVTGPDGMRTFGMVERVDHAAGRAVVRVGRPGGSARLSEEGLEAVLRDLKTPGGR